MSDADAARSDPFANGPAGDAACPSEDELVAMIEGAISAQELARIEQHVAACEACAAVVGDLGALGDAAKPRQVDRYQLDRRIAAGGMGEVWAAWDPKLRREIAVKLVRPERSDDTRERDRLLREARALARLTHPNVIAVHDVGEQDGEVFIVSELVAGDTLANRGGPSADWRVVVRLYAQAARGLAAAHAAGLVHRDVKPANLLLGLDGRVRVADFGLAVRSKTPSPIAATETPDIDASQSITHRGHIAGTPAYMAPEQRAGGKVEAAADQFALAVAIGEALTGRRPTMEMSAAEVVAFVGERRAMEPDLATLCELVARGLAVDPADRFPDMAAFADALDALVPPIKASGEHRAVPRTPTGGVRALRSPSSSEGAPSPGAGTSRGAPPTLPVRSRWSGTLVIAGVVVIAAGIAAVLLLRDRGDGAPPPAEPAATPPAPTTPAPTPTPAPTATPTATQPGDKTVRRDGPAVPEAVVAETAPFDAMSPAARTVARAAPTGTAMTGTATDGATTDGAPTGAATTGAATTGAATTGAATTGAATGSGSAPPAATSRATSSRISTRATTTTTTGAAPSASGELRVTTAPTAAAAQPSAVTLDTVSAAIRRRDGAACRRALAQLASPPPTDLRVASAHALCEMLAGNCEGGLREQRALAARDNLPAATADGVADLYCPVDGSPDPAVRLRRLSRQLTMFATSFDCDAYLPHARAAAKRVLAAAPARSHSDATPAGDQRVIGSALREIAACYSRRGDCATARTVLDEAKVFVPALATNELAAACR